MASYKVVWQKSAAKNFRFIPKQQSERIFEKVQLLEDNPRPMQSLKLEGSDARLYRLRVGDYRVIYEINDHEKTATIYEVRHRKDIYRKS